MKTAICLFVRNERRDILEWILHHVAIGFDTVLIMDNNSEDGTPDVAQSAARLHDVRVASWPEISEISQRRCYDHLLHKYGPEFDWMAFIDADEFIIPERDRTIKAFLTAIGEHAAVGLHWAIFGSGGHAAPPHGLVMENFVHRAAADFPSNRHIKSIIRPSQASYAINPHAFDLHAQYADEDGVLRSDYVNAAGKRITWADEPGIVAGTVDLSICRIHHYYLRSRQHFEEKIRRKTWRDPHRAPEEFIYNDRNDIRDLSAIPFAASVHILADQIRPPSRFTPSRYGALPNVPFANRRR